MTLRTLKYLSLFPLICCFSIAQGQSYEAGISDYRKQYINDLLAEPRKPIQQTDVKYIQFYPVDARYKVSADFTPSPGATPFLIATHSGKQKPFREFGTLTFIIHDSVQVLHLYQSINLVNSNNHNDELFIPFNDKTNYSATFGGGRYIDIRESDIVNGHCVLDFNKCYNPYCAYAEGFSCPIPPSANHLYVAIPAGEKMFTKNIAY
ncbi:MAG: DUF1684 domain-containing protein [Taibaiella sp.]|nr:DUF1684 domain-containing protein [Taibaiella sp.]